MTKSNMTPKVDGAKQSKTRESRVEKCMQPILNGKGLND
jgi:uncharacterized protein YdeI (YjbR/CyaY-like superfamily)